MMSNSPPSRLVVTLHNKVIFFLTHECCEMSPLEPGFLPFRSFTGNGMQSQCHFHGGSRNSWVRWSSTDRWGMGSCCSTKSCKILRHIWQEELKVRHYLFAVLYRTNLRSANNTGSNKDTIDMHVQHIGLTLHIKRNDTDLEYNMMLW